MTNSAAYVGRVGGLAVALGIGASVASGYGVAWADPANASSDSSGSSSTPSWASSVSSPGSPRIAAAATGSTIGATKSTNAGSRTSAFTPPTNPPVGPAAQSPSGATGLNRADGVASDTAKRGGLLVAGTASEPTSTPPANDVLTTVQQDVAPQAPGLNQAIAATDPPNTAPTATAATSTTVQTPETPGVEATTSALTSGSTPTINAVESTTSTQLARPEGTVLGTVAATSAAIAQPSTAASAAAVESAVMNSSAMPANTVAPQAVPTLFSGPLAPLNVITGVVSSVLAAFGLSPLAANTPLAPAAPAPTLLGVLDLVRREFEAALAPMSPPAQPVLTTSTMPDPSATAVTGSIPGVASASAVNAAVTTTAAPVQAAAPQTAPPSLLQILQYTFFNQTPTANPTQDPGQSAIGVITGSLNASSPNGAQLTYAVTQNPADGSVVVNPDGSYTYTPKPGLATTGGPDQFTVTIDAGSAYRQPGVIGVIQGWLHSFAQAIGLSGPDTYTANVTVTVAPVPDPSLLFTRTVLLSGLNLPTDFGFLPDGRILIADRPGAIQVFNSDTGQLQNQPLITLPVDSTGNRGIVGIAVDPTFQNNGYIYVSYVTANNYERLSRLTITDPSAAVLTVNPTSEDVLLQGNQPAADDHLAGAIRFGPDGKLYWSVGNNDYYFSGDAPPGAVYPSNNAQDLSNIYGKILRLNPDGTVPADNPFVNTPGANPYIYAYGFRNPFRMGFTPDGKLLVGDVGEGTWEELDNVTAGGNYGWPLAEGPQTFSPCASCVSPIYAYPHNGTYASITSVLVYTGSTFGTSFQNKVFIADFSQGWIQELTCTSGYSSCGSARMFDPGTGVLFDGPVELLQGPDGNIYELVFDTGELSRIAPSSG
jgi:glucose/arabinose dehydrogenase